MPLLRLHEPVDTDVKVILQNAAEHADRPAETSGRWDFLGVEFCLNLPDRLATQGEIKDQANSRCFSLVRLIRTANCAVSIYICTARLFTFTRFLQLSPVHVAQQLTAKVLGQNAVKIEHEDRKIFRKVKLLCFDNEFCAAPGERVGDLADVSQILGSRKPVGFFHPQRINPTAANALQDILENWPGCNRGT